MTSQIHHGPEPTTANPLRTQLLPGEPADESPHEAGDEIAKAAERAGRERQRPETD